MWIFFNGDEEGTGGEDGSTCANVRFGIRQLIKKNELALHCAGDGDGQRNTRYGDALIRQGHVYRVPDHHHGLFGSTSN